MTAMRLVDVEPGRKVRVLRFEGGRGLGTKLAGHGLYPGDMLRVMRRAPLGGPILIEVGGREIALGRGVAARIVVETD